MTKARGPHVRQRVSTKLFFCALYGNKRWEKHPDLWQSFYFSLGPRHACSLLGSHDYDLDLLGYFQS